MMISTRTSKENAIPKPQMAILHAMIVADYLQNRSWILQHKYYTMAMTILTIAKQSKIVHMTIKIKVAQPTPIIKTRHAR